MNKYRLSWAQLTLDERGKLAEPVLVTEKTYSAYTMHAVLEMWRNDLVGQMVSLGRYKKYFGNRVYGHWEEDGKKLFSRAEVMEINCIGNEQPFLQNVIRRRNESGKA